MDGVQPANTQGLTIKNRKMSLPRLLRNNVELMILSHAPHRKLFICWSVTVVSIGRTSRKFHVRLGVHVNNIKKGLKKHNVSRHFKLPNRDSRDLKFWCIEKVKGHWRGGNFIRELSHRESYWKPRWESLFA